MWSRWCSAPARGKPISQVQGNGASWHVHVPVQLRKLQCWRRSIRMIKLNERTIQQIQYFCKVMGNDIESDFDQLTETEQAWQRGYTQAMKHVMLWIENPNIFMVPKSAYEKVSEK